jgi:CRISPR-associated endonuclease/helicase Cas3
MDTRWVMTGKLLSEAAGFVHDIGKASQRFAEKLHATGPIEADEVRHEWLSMKLLQALRRNGWNWELAWKKINRGLLAVTLGDREVGSLKPLYVENALEAVDLLVATHHGLFQCQAGSRTPTPMCPTSRGRHVRTERPGAQQLSPSGTIGESVWKRYQSAESALLEAASGRGGDIEYWRSLTLLSRAALIAADHWVSRELMPEIGDQDLVYANTAIFDGRRGLNQPLDWHLQEVGRRAGECFLRFSDLMRSATHSALPGIPVDIQTRIMAAAGSAGRFEWQNHAAAALEAGRSGRPCLVFNLAGTGSGKTRMNLRAACALSRDESPRVSIALNLRSLTLQTGRALRQSLGLTGDLLACVIGDVLTRTLFERSEPLDEDENPAEIEVQVDGNRAPCPAWLQDLAPRSDDQALLQAPVLVSTIDYLIAAGEPATQGHHVKALLRVVSSDLVLDEVDSYEPEALVAVLRVVQWSAMAGRNIVCSSATLSAPTANAVHQAFRSGVSMREALFGRVDYQIAMIDDCLDPEIRSQVTSGDEFSTWYASRLEAIGRSLDTAPVYRLAQLQPVHEISIRGWNAAVLAGVRRMHELHSWAFGETSKRVSFGLVRVANIGTAVDTARYLAGELPNAMVACYHAGEFLIARFHKERRLDALLTRSRGDLRIIDDLEIRTLVASANAMDVLFVVVATPVEEIGRDHDFDWGVLDASSAQALVQGSGRINRHRLLPCQGKPNIAVLQFNWRHCRNEGNRDMPAFAWPGYEKVANASSPYAGHDLSELLPWVDDQLVVNAGLRFDPQCRLAVADDEAIAARVRPHFGMEGAFVLRNSHSWLLTQGAGSPYDFAQLREPSGKQEVWLAKDTDPISFARRERVAARGTVTDRWIPDTMATTPAMPNSWLASAPAMMEKLCNELDVRPEHAMSATLTTYNTSFRYDLGFGVKRVV